MLPTEPSRSWPTQALPQAQSALRTSERPGPAARRSTATEPICRHFAARWDPRRRATARQSRPRLREAPRREGRRLALVDQTPKRLARCPAHRSVRRALHPVARQAASWIRFWRSSEKEWWRSGIIAVGSDAPRSHGSKGMNCRAFVDSLGHRMHQPIERSGQRPDPPSRPERLWSLCAACSINSEPPFFKAAANRSAPRIPRTAPFSRPNSRALVRRSVEPPQRPLHRQGF